MLKLFTSKSFIQLKSLGRGLQPYVHLRAHQRAVHKEDVDIGFHYYIVLRDNAGVLADGRRARMNGGSYLSWLVCMVG